MPKYKEPAQVNRNTGVFFFAPRAVRPNSPVTVEQKRDKSPLMAKSPIKAGADDRIPPSQECSPHPGKKQQKTTQHNQQKSQKWWVKALHNCTKAASKKTGRTQRQQRKTLPKNEIRQIKKLPANREKAEIPISVVKHVRLQLAWTGDRVPVTKRHKNRSHSLSPLSTPRTTVPA